MNETRGHFTRTMAKIVTYVIRTTILTRLFLSGTRVQSILVRTVTRRNLWRKDYRAHLK